MLEQVLEAPGLQGPIRLCICMYNGGKFTLLPDPLPEAAGIPAAAAAAAAAAGGAEAGGGGSDTLTAQAAGGSGGSSAAAAVALPLSAKLSLGAMYAVLRQAVKNRIRSLSLFCDAIFHTENAAVILPRQARDKHTGKAALKKKRMCHAFSSLLTGAERQGDVPRGTRGDPGARKTPSFASHLYIKTRAFCQDRLGTNVRKR